MNIYYINLDRSPKRDELMRLQLQRNTDIKFKRVRAVDGSDTRDLGNHLIINNTYFRDRLFAWGGNRMQTTLQKRQSIICIQKQLACLVSHLLAIKEAYNDGLNEATVELANNVWHSMGLDRLYDQFSAKAGKVT